jgi:hypothetical protein
MFLNYVVQFNYLFCFSGDHCQSAYPKVMQPAPDFSGQAVVNKQFKEISLKDYKDKWLVLFFYPLDL